MHPCGTSFPPFFFISILRMAYVQYSHSDTKFALATRGREGASERPVAQDLEVAPDPQDDPDEQQGEQGQRDEEP